MLSVIRSRNVYSDKSVILQLHIAQHIREKQYICGLVTHQFRIIEKTKYVFGVPQKYEYAYSLIIICKLFK